MKTKLSILTYFILILIGHSYANETFKFRTVSPPGGFTYNGVSGIQQDSDGFIWILMDEDIFRFDGYTYKRYTTHFKEIDSYREWIFESITTNTNRKLYVNTNNGLFVYDNIVDKFVRLGEKIYKTIIIDAKNQLWGWDGNAWQIMNPETKELITPQLNGRISKNITNVYCTHNDDLYMFGHYSNIYKYEYSNKKFVLCTTLPDKTKRILAAKTFKGKLWVLAEKGALYRLNLTTFNIEETFELLDKNTKFSGRSFCLDKNGNFWMGTIKGLYVFNTQTELTTRYLHSESDPFSLPNNSIWTISEDKQRNIWIGTYSGSVCYVNLNEKQAFETYLPQDKKLNHAPVSAFAEDKNSLWIGTEGGGINRVDKNTGIFTYLTQDNGISRISSNNIKSIVVDNNDNIWIGTFTGGIDFYNPRTGAVNNFRRENNNHSLRNNNIRKIVLDNSSGLWIAYQQIKLEISFYSFATKSFTHYDFSKQHSDVYIFDILKGRDGQLWILTKEKLFLFDTKAEKLREVKFDDYKFLDLNTFCMDDSGNIWIGTLGSGLVKFSPEIDKITIFNEMLQRNTYSIFNICYDTEGYLWMGTDNGLVSFNIKNSEISHFTKNDGIQGQVYYPRATMKGVDGKLYFGGTSGFTIIDSKEITLNQYKPRVIISDILINYKSAKLKIENKSNTQEIRLKYNQNNIGFKFSSDNFLIPEKMYFKYRLKGYNNRWIEVDAHNRSAFYSKVPPGVYYFEVLAANNDGVWNEQPTVMKIVCRPAPWFSWPAYLLYFIAALLAIYYVYRHFQVKKKLELQLYLDGVEKNKKEEIHQSQLRFFTNISHDFRTPLSLIIAALERLRIEGLKEYYYRILNGNAQRLLKLVNELMDFRALEHSKVKLELRQLNLNNFIKEIAVDFIDFAGQKNITFEVNCDTQLPEKLYFDKNIVEKVVMNLLNNAFKHTPEGGKIEISTHMAKFESKHKNFFVVNGDYMPVNSFNITVSDTGVGISKESIQSVFERFYKVSSDNLDSHLGTGIGLALVKSLVLLHRGKITINSERFVGTDISVEFSSNEKIYDPDCFAEDTQDTVAVEETTTVAPKDINTIVKNTVQKSKKKILFAEDNEALRNLIADYLADSYEVVQAEDGLVAKTILSKKSIDIIVSDIMMPNVDGISFCKETKNNIETSHIPIILLTAKSGIESKLEGMDSGADYYLEKPVSPELLKKTIHNIFKQQQHLKEFYAKNHFADSSKLTSNVKDAEFLKKFIDIIDKNLHQSDMDINNIASEMSMSRSKLYRKLKTMTDMSIIQFILSYKLKKAAKLMIEKDMTIREIMDEIGIESQPYFTNAFKKEFGETPTAFATRHKEQS